MSKTDQMAFIANNVLDMYQLKQKYKYNYDENERHAIFSIARKISRYRSIEIPEASNRINEKNVSMQGIGYKEILEYLEGKVSFDQAINNLRLNTRHFAKRQLTWFRHENDTIMINKDEYENDDAILEYMTGILRTKGIIY